MLRMDKDKKEREMRTEIRAERQEEARSDNLPRKRLKYGTGDKVSTGSES